ncbi:MAG: phosphoribosylaminoimidazolesuccinocarboxamide synthase [Elusimicrobia bacterium GWA2_62_23]|nr:MAG: phosphoribosylaminoimidazolesuccinocarboxamide synthase [Elusimicrobia bacterium GWA2_62_23]OGR68133.1 MAG: phosphoribosylaminoimidazolesuccinocarboxamide synthase [Elusimicrobia bacterium GWC2_63_65]
MRMLELKLMHKGKVRDLYSAGEKYLLIVSSDRISAFDFILPTPVPGKGALLNKISKFWFDRTGHIIKNHIVSTEIEDIRGRVSAPAGFDWEYMRGRAMLVHRAKRVDFECVVRGYITGSGWKEYLKQGSVCGLKLPAGLKEAQKLPEPLFTPTTKADQGHDENVTFETMAAALAPGLALTIKETSLALYKFAAEHLERRGILLADTKLEFGLLDGELILIDEALTPDSSRFWDAARYKTGTSPASYDKQYVRDWLEGSGWDKKSAPPGLPEEVVQGTLEKYEEALQKITEAG